MSFYIGKKDNGDSLCHITHGTHTIDEMKDGIISNTIFHSDVSYVTYDYYTITKVGTPNILVSLAADGSGTNFYRPHAVYSLPTECLNKLIDGYAYFILTSIGRNMTSNIGASYPVLRFANFVSSQVQGNQIYVPRNFVSVTSGNIHWNDAPGSPSSVYKYLAINNGYTTSPSTLTLVVLNFKPNGVIDPLTKIGTATDIGNGKFVVNGIDLAKTKFLSKFEVNSSNYNFDLGTNSGIRNMQMLNSTTYNQSVNISSNATATEVAIGGEKIIDSSITPIGLKIKSFNTTTVPATSYTSDGYNVNYTLPSLTATQSCFIAIRFKGEAYSVQSFGRFDGVYSFIYDNNFTTSVSSGLSGFLTPVLMRGNNFIANGAGYEPVVVVYLRISGSSIQLGNYRYFFLGRTFTMPEMEISYIIFE
jgi:hypothetical protein